MREADAAEQLEAGERYQRGGALDRALKSFRRAVELSSDPVVIAEGLRRQADVHRFRCEWDAALTAARRSGEVARRAGLEGSAVEALNAEAAIHLSRGDFDTAQQLLEQVLATARDDRVRGVALQNAGSVAAQQGRLADAERCFLQSSECFSRAGYRLGEAFALTNSGAAALDRGSLDEAQALLERATRAAKLAGDLDCLAIATKNLAEVHAERQDYARAEELASTALGYFSDTANTWRRVECFRFLGDLNLRLGYADAAASCYAKGLQMAEEAALEREVVKLRERLARLAERRAEPGSRSDASGPRSGDPPYGS